MFIFPVDPLAHIMRGFREYLLEKAVYALVTPGYKNHLKLKPENSSDWWAHKYIVINVNLRGSHLVPPGYPM